MLRGDSAIQWTPIKVSFGQRRERKERDLRGRELILRLVLLLWFRFAGDLQTPAQLEGSKQLLSFFHQYVKHCLTVAFFVGFETKQRSTSTTLPLPKLNLDILTASIESFQELHDDLTTRHLAVLETFPSNAFAAPSGGHSHGSEACSGHGDGGGGAGNGKASVVGHVKACQKDILELVEIVKKAVEGGGVMSEPTKEAEEGQPWMICEARDLGSNVVSGCVEGKGGKKELMACGKVSFDDGEVAFFFFLVRALFELERIDRADFRRFSDLHFVAVLVESILLCW